MLIDFDRLWMTFGGQWGGLGGHLDIILVDFGRLWVDFGRLLVACWSTLVAFGDHWGPLGTLGRPCASKAETNRKTLNLFWPPNRPESTSKTKKDRSDTTSEKQHKNIEKQTSLTNFLVKSELEKHGFVWRFTIQS
jgi:hypothetical protein